MAAASEGEASHGRLLSVFKKVDESGSGRMALDTFVHMLTQLGFTPEDAEQLIKGGNCCVVASVDGTDEVDYEAFVRWIAGGSRSVDLMDAGNEDRSAAQKHPSTSSSPSGGFGGWIERCARILETRSEVDFVQKKLITSQVRAHIRAIESEVEPEAIFETAEAGTQTRTRNSRSGLLERRPVPLEGCTPELDWDGPALLQKLLQGGAGKLPKSYVHKVLDAVLIALPHYHPKPLVRLQVPQDGRMVVVGDTHGQLQDVLLIMLLHGMPAAKNAFLFNGDVADRGNNACEIFMLIFAFYLAGPESVLMTRGNHEDDEMNMRLPDEGGGFYDEVVGKYDEVTFWKFVEVFKLLPLAAVINGEVFVVHGGLPSCPLKFSYIEDIPHNEMCCPPADSVGEEATQEKVFSDLLWSDPAENPGASPNPRGAGSLWGPDITKDFLAENGLRWMIRSHELPFDGVRGWMEHHLGLVFTLFSASNYQGYEVNWGAVALLTVGADGRLEQALREHNIACMDDLKTVAAVPEGPLREERARGIGLAWVDHDRVAVGDRRVQLALRRLAGIVIECKLELWQHFRSKDPENTGTISRADWEASLVAVCDDSLPWEEASKGWIDADVKIVDYRRFLDRFKVVLSQTRWCGWKSLVISEVYEELLSRNAAAQDMLNTFDPSGDGLVCAEDFAALMHECCGGCLSEPQVAALSRTIFANSEGRGLRMNRFLSRFSLTFVQSQGMSLTDKVGPMGRYGSTINQIGQLIFHSNKSKTSRPLQAGTLAEPSTLPSQLPGSATGGLPPPVCLERWVSHPTRLPSSTQPIPEDSEAPLPPPGETEDSPAPLSSTVPLPPPPPLNRASTDEVQPPLLMRREVSSALVRTFEAFNDAGDGFLQVDEFVRHVMALPGFGDIRHDGRPLDAATLREVALDIASEHSANGTINLLQFARAFAAVDASGSEDLATDLHEHILTFLFRHREALRTNCAEHDPEGSGHVTKRVFARVLEAVNFCTAKPKRHLTRVQMSVLAESLAEDDGTVMYLAFLSSFEVLAE